MRSANAIFALSLVLAAASLGCGDDTKTVLGPDLSGQDVGDAGGGGDTRVGEDTVVGEDTGEREAPLALESFTLTQNPRNLLSFYAEWETNIPATTVLEFDCGVGEAGVLASDAMTTRHSVYAMGFLESAICEVVASGVSAGGQLAQEEQTYLVAELDDDRYPPATITLTEPHRLQPGWNLFNLNNHFDNLVMRVVMVDELGRYRWYYRSPFRNAGSDNDVRTVPQGVLVGGVGDMMPQLITWDGEVLWQGTRRMHHDIQAWPDESHLTYLGVHIDDCDEANPSPIVERVNVDSNELAWEWALCHHFDPITDERDWEHSNAIEPVPGENAFLLSARNLNALIKVDFDTGEPLWTLGFGARPEDGFSGDFDVAEEDRFYRQHAPEILGDESHILLFDNGLDDWRAESRAIELDLDFDAMSAEVVWEYRHDPPVYTDIWGDADSLPNGNRLITFGIRNRDQGSILVEADSEADSTPLWVLELPGKWGIYRAERVIEIPRGFVMEVAE